MDSGEKYQLSYWIDRVELRVGNVVTETTYSGLRRSSTSPTIAATCSSRVASHRSAAERPCSISPTQRTNTHNPYVVMPVPANVKAAYPASAATAVPPAIPSAAAAETRRRRAPAANVPTPRDGGRAS